MKKYILTDETKVINRNMEMVTLHRIESIKDFGNIKKGQKGGWVQSESNLSQEGECWIADEAIVIGDALVEGNAFVREDASVAEYAVIRGNARIYGHATISGLVHIDEFAVVEGHAFVHEYAVIEGCATIKAHADVGGGAYVGEYAVVEGCAMVFGEASVKGYAIISDNAVVFGKAKIYTINGSEAYICDNAKIYGRAVVKACVKGMATIGGNAVIDSKNDYFVFENFYQGTNITYTKSNDRYGYNGRTYDEDELIAIGKNEVDEKRLVALVNLVWAYYHTDEYKNIVVMPKDEKEETL